MLHSHNVDVDYILNILLNVLNVENLHTNGQRQCNKKECIKHFYMSHVKILQVSRGHFYNIRYLRVQFCSHTM